MKHFETNKKSRKFVMLFRALAEQIIYYLNFRISNILMICSVVTVDFSNVGLAVPAVGFTAIENWQ